MESGESECNALCAQVVKCSASYPKVGSVSYLRLLAAEAWFRFQGSTIFKERSNNAAVLAVCSCHSTSARCLLSPGTATTGPTGAVVAVPGDSREASACKPDTEIYSDLPEFRYFRVLPDL